MWLSREIFFIRWSVSCFVTDLFHHRQAECLSNPRFRRAKSKYFARKPAKEAKKELWVRKRAAIFMFWEVRKVGRPVLTGKIAKYALTPPWKSQLSTSQLWLNQVNPRLPPGDALKFFSNEWKKGVKICEAKLLPQTSLSQSGRWNKRISRQIFCWHLKGFLFYFISVFSLSAWERLVYEQSNWTRCLCSVLSGVLASSRSNLVLKRAKF